MPTLLDQLPMIHRAKGRGVKRARADSGSERAGGREGEEMGEVVAEAYGGVSGPSADIIETAVGQLLTLNCITGWWGDLLLKLDLGYRVRSLVLETYQCGVDRPGL